VPSVFPGRLRTGVAAACTAGALALSAAPASAQGTPVTVPSGFHVSQFAASDGTISKPDDIVQLGDRIFVAWQNGVSATGSPSGSTSTVIEYNARGRAIWKWTPTGRVDGLAADPVRHLIYATVNEDANSSFYVIDPRGDARQLTYNDPQGVMTGGSDAISIDPEGNVYISMSNPGPANASAVALASIDSPPGEVTLSPTFPDNLSGVNDGNHPGSTTTLALTDPDSNAIVPRSSPRFADMFMLDSQGDGQLVFAPFGFDSSTPASQITQLTLNVPGASSHPVVDDVRWAPHDGGTLLVVDQGAGVVYKITGPFQAGQALASQPTDPSNPPFQSDVVDVNLWNGTESPFATGFTSPKGLLFLGRSREGDEEGGHGHDGGQGQQGETGSGGGQGDQGSQGQGGPDGRHGHGAQHAAKRA
jgi:hypothetical protein